MEVQPLETIIAELVSDDWLKTGCAINKLIPHDEAATRALPIVFELTLHDKAPVRSYSSALIRRLGKHAVPFLRDKAADECPDHRAMAITLLTETGCRWATSTRLVEQILDDRRDDLPDWGANPEEIIQLFKTALDDESLQVRFNAACALEEFGRHIPETVPVFIEALQTGTPHQQNWAALHLGRIGPSAVAASRALKMAADSQYRYTALAASNALKRLGPAESAS
jgi:HEAT repeat protein